MQAKVDRGREFSCKRASCSAISLEERRGHSKVILSSFSCVEDGKIKRQTRNKYSMHVFFKAFSFFHSLSSSLIIFLLSVSTVSRNGLLSKRQTGVNKGREGVENRQTYVEMLYG